jgi:hypothetical protein
VTEANQIYIAQQYVNRLEVALAQHPAKTGKYYSKMSQNNDSARRNAGKGNFHSGLHSLANLPVGVAAIPANVPYSHQVLVRVPAHLF